MLKPSPSKLLAFLNTGLRLVAIAAVAGLQWGCAQDGGGSPLADRELREGSEIYIGDSRYHLTQVSEQASESSSSSSKPEEAENAPAQAAAGGASGAASAPAKKPTPRPTPRPIDVDYILTKSRDISVGVSADIPKARIQNEAKPFIPASITKVLTTAVALKHLGPDFRFKTTVSFVQEGAVAKDIVIVADGDPTVEIDSYAAGSPRRMTEMAMALKEKGVKEIRGPITLLSAHAQLDDVRYAVGIPTIDMRECYGSLASSFNYHWNCANARIHPKSGFRWESSGIESLLAGTLDTSAGEKNSLAIDVLLSPDRVLEGFRLRGSYNAKSPRVINWKLPIGNSAGWYGQEFYQALKAKQVKVPSDAAVRFAKSDADRREAATMLKQSGRIELNFESADLAALSEATNKPSDNFLADSILKAVGVRSAGGNTAGDALALGQAKMSEFIANWLARDGQAQLKDEMRFHEGAGLSNQNSATPRAFMAVLRQLPEEAFFPALWDSLPSAGEDGTLAGRMGKTIVEGRVRGKTGTLTGSYQLVGYIPKQAGSRVEYVPFVILTSTSARNRDKVRKFQDALVVKMAETIGRRELADR